MLISSRFWLGFEILLIVAPLTAVFAFFAPLPLVHPIGPYLPFGVMMQLAIVETAAALVAGWYLLYVFMRRGKRALNSTSPLAWILALGGVCVGLLSALSNHLPPSDPYSPWDNFRSDFGRFSIGLFLVLPLLHLWIERVREPLSNERLERP